jgi:agmatinase
MSTEQPFQGIRTFLKAKTQPIINGIKIIGVPLDATTSFRSGARHGPAAIREASLMLTDGNHPVFRNELNYNKLCDAGDFPVNNADPKKSLNSLTDYLYENYNPKICNLLLGGDHTITYPAINALSYRFDRRVSIVHFDAHCDTWKDHWGTSLAHGTWLYHAIEMGFVDPTTSIQIGIRSPADPVTADYFSIRGGTVINNRAFLKNDLDSIINNIRNVVNDNPVYLTFDIDCLDPAYAPGTGTPEIGGLTTLQAQYILENLNLKWIGADFVEVAPAYDHANITSLAAASLAYTWICQMQSTFGILYYK